LTLNLGFSSGYSLADTLSSTLLSLLAALMDFFLNSCYFSELQKLSQKNMILFFYSSPIMTSF